MPSKPKDEIQVGDIVFVAEGSFFCEDSLTYFRRLGIRAMDEPLIVTRVMQPHAWVRLLNKPKGGEMGGLAARLRKDPFLERIYEIYHETNTDR